MRRPFLAVVCHVDGEWNETAISLGPFTSYGRIWRVRWWPESPRHAILAHNQVEIPSVD
jgi:hypothetical protein